MASKVTAHLEARRWNPAPGTHAGTWRTGRKVRIAGQFGKILLTEGKHVNEESADGNVQIVHGLVSSLDEWEITVVFIPAVHDAEKECTRRATERIGSRIGLA
jgi:hypothetical protein